MWNIFCQKGFVWTGKIDTSVTLTLASALSASRSLAEVQTHKFSYWLDLNCFILNFCVNMSMQPEMRKFVNSNVCGDTGG